MKRGRETRWQEFYAQSIENADVAIREFLIDHARDDRHDPRAVPLDPGERARRKQIEHQKLQRMIAYAESAACLRATILRYFGDPSVKEPCGACGNCDRRGRLDDTGRLQIRRVLSGIARASDRYGWRKIAAMLTSRPEDPPEPIGLCDDPDGTFRIRPISRDDIARLLHHLWTQR